MNLEETLQDLKRVLKSEPVYIDDDDDHVGPSANKYQVKSIGGQKVVKAKPLVTKQIVDDGLRDVYSQHPIITDWAHTRQKWFDAQGGMGNMRFYQIPAPILLKADMMPPARLPPMIVDSGVRNAAGINPDLAKWQGKKQEWEEKIFPKIYTNPEPRVMTLTEIYPPTNEAIVSDIYGSSTKHPPNSVLRDIFEEYLVTNDRPTYMDKTLHTDLSHIFLYIRGELVRCDITNFLHEYVAHCEPWLLVPPPPGENFLAELAFLTKYLMYDIDNKQNGIIRNFANGLFGTTPKVGMFDKIGRWLNPYAFISSKGTFGFDTTTDKINFGCINTFIA